MGHGQALLELEPKNINNNDGSRAYKHRVTHLRSCNDYSYCCVIDLKQPCVP